MDSMIYSIILVVAYVVAMIALLRPRYSRIKVRVPIDVIKDLEESRKEIQEHLDAVRQGKIKTVDDRLDEITDSLNIFNQKIKDIENRLAKIEKKLGITP